MRRRNLTVRTIALMGAGSAAIHQLRYAIGYGDGASSALAAHPHGYLTAALPGVATALLIALASTLLHLAGRDRSVRTRSLSLGQLWLACALGLAAIYGVQETLEGSGAILGGGWIGIALALPAGLLVALSLHGAAAAEAIRNGLAPLVAFHFGHTHVARGPLAPHGRIGRGRVRSRGPPTLSVV